MTDQTSETNPVASIRSRLLKQREALLDLSARNRLLNTPLRANRNKAIEIVDEKSAEVLRILSEGRAMGFLPGRELSEKERAELDADDVITGGVPQPGDDALDERGVAARHTDLRLQTRLTSEGLQKRLLDMTYDAATLEEEQGVNILYLAMGLLKWFDSDASDIARHAPLILLPVKLERVSAADRFKLKWREEPPSPNITLQAKLKKEFAVSIPDFNDEDNVELGEYFAKIAELVSEQKRWEVLPDAMVLGFYSFSKFLMYRDLDPDLWPASRIDQHPSITALLRDGFPMSEPLVDDDDCQIDGIISPIDTHHILDADSSQAVAIAEAARGRSLVVKGPPGTGKSQTIANMIAAAAASGKKVLFVAEKMAALDVVHRRLKRAGLGPLTLELHSNKANKRVVLEELKRTLEGEFRQAHLPDTVIRKVGETRESLNEFAARLHTPIAPSQLTAHQILGLLAKTRDFEVPDFALYGAEGWNSEHAEEGREAALEVARSLEEVGPVPKNPWRGVNRAPIDPTEQDDLAGRIDEAVFLLEEAFSFATSASNALGIKAPSTFAEISNLLKSLAILPMPHGFDQAALAAEQWRKSGLASLLSLVGAGEDLRDAEAAIAGVVNDAGRDAQYAGIRMAIVAKGSSPFRFLDQNYRTSIRLLKSYLNDAPPKSAFERIQLVDRIVKAQSARACFEDAKADGIAFGNVWAGQQSDWPQLSKILEWRAKHDALPDSLWKNLSSIEDVSELEKTGHRLADRFRKLDEKATGLLEFLSLDVGVAFSMQDWKTIEHPELSARLHEWRRNLPALGRYIAFRQRVRHFSDFGARDIIAAIDNGWNEPQLISQAFDRAYAATLRVVLFKDWPELREFDGDIHNRKIEAFRQLDRAHIEIAKQQIAAHHAASRPRTSSGAVGPLGVLKAELAKKRRHKPLRTLLDEAGPAIQGLKPVFMMSPLSVAQFLKPGGLQFDLLVMDEASQIEPVDALGAVARADQLVVVGDERQLPPTAFFRKLTGDDDIAEDPDDEAIQAKDAESILDLCLAKLLPYRMLNWHYRSKHQSLIAVSNREFYENRLFIVPSPYDAVAGMGLKFNHLKNAAYDRGGTRANPVEARIIAERVIEHALQSPEKSLGVATFSVAQRKAVLDELELLRRANPEAEPFFGADREEPFFVKNLENIQGDERDVIFISIGYGKTAEGYLAHNFGPLSGEGGERRLNVLISRAKLRCEVFSNFTGADIDLERTKARGVAALKMFMTFAETGHFGLGEAGVGDFDSEFEAHVCSKLRSRGYDLKQQIGASGFRVDLAIVDPDKPGRFLLGIECDGAQYHSSRSARDRDRLRQQVLEAHDWIIHRIWSADWYLRQEHELEKLEAAVASAKTVWADRDESRSSPTAHSAVRFEIEELSDETIVAAVLHDAEETYSRDQTANYVEASFAVRNSLELHETPIADLTAYVVKIVEIEGPIHVEEIITRLRTLWGLQRAGGRIRSVVERAIDIARRRGLVEGDVFVLAPSSEVKVRNRANVSSASLRRPEMLPPAEIDLAIAEILAANFGAAEEELTQSAARAFGYSSTSSRLRELFARRIAWLQENGRITLSSDLYSLNEDAPSSPGESALH